MTQLHGGVAERSCVRLQKNWQQRSQRIYRGSNPLPTFDPPFLNISATKLANNQARYYQNQFMHQLH
jgi:hypothetical protein